MGSNQTDPLRHCAECRGRLACGCIDGCQYICHVCNSCASQNLQPAATTILGRAEEDAIIAAGWVAAFRGVHLICRTTFEVDLEGSGGAAVAISVNS